MQKFSLFILTVLVLIGGIFLWQNQPKKVEAAAELITDGSFELASPSWIWGGPGDHKRDSQYPHTGSWSALTGFRDKANVANGYDYVYQDITIPSGATSVTLSFWYRFMTNDYCNYDFATMQIRDTANNVLATPLNYCCSGCLGFNDLGWKKVTYDLTRYAGQTIRLWFETSNRFDSYYKSWTYYDDVSVTYTAPNIGLPSGIITAPSSASVATDFTVNIDGTDDSGVIRIDLYYHGSWHSQSCPGTTSCSRSWTFQEGVAGHYRYHGNVWNVSNNPSSWVCNGPAIATCHSDCQELGYISGQNYSGGTFCGTNQCLCYRKNPPPIEILIE